MKYNIDEKVVEDKGMNIPLFFLIMALRRKPDLNNLVKEALLKEYIVFSPNIGYIVTPNWEKEVEDILCTSDTAIPKEDDLIPLAEKLMSIYPQGRKPGTPYYWKGNKREIALKLKSFYKRYGRKYTEDEIANATQEYVDSFNGDYTFMRLLKYFIWKQDKGTMDESSELATLIDNKDQEDVNKEDWNTQLR